MMKRSGTLNVLGTHATAWIVAGMTMGGMLEPAQSSETVPTGRWNAGDDWTQVEAGWTFDGGRLQHAYWADAVLSGSVEVEALLEIGDSTLAGWKTAGVSIYHDRRNYWALQLVETPDSTAQKARFVQLMAMRNGLWGAQNQPGVTQLRRTLHDASVPWRPETLYRLKLSMDAGGIRGTVWEADGGRVVADIGYVFDAEADAVVSGRPGLVAEGFRASYRDIVSKSGEPWSAPPRRVRNLLKNPGFESGMDGWKWDTQQGGRAVGTVVTSEAHGGKASFHLSHDASGRPVSRIFTTVKGLFPETRYTFSAWVKGRDARGFVGGREDWSVRGRYANTGEWQRVSVHYRTRPGETEFMFMVVLEGSDMEVWVDSLEVALQDMDDLPRLYDPRVIDVSAESTEQPTGFLLRGNVRRVSEHDLIEGVFIQAASESPIEAEEAFFTLRDEQGVVVSEIGAVMLPAITHGQSRQVAFILPADPLPQGLIRIEARFLSETVAVEVDRFSFVEETRVAVDKALTEASGLLQEVDARLEASPEFARDAYVAMGTEIARRYVSRARVGGPSGRQGLWQQWRDNPVAARRDTALWNLLQAEESGAILRDTLARIEALADGSSLVWVVPPAEMLPEGAAFIGMDVSVDTTRNDLAFLRKAGVRLVQREQGPNAWTKEGEWRGRDVLKQWMSDADTVGMKLDLLVSPHYFPNWVYADHPDAELKGERFFIKFQIDHPETRNVVERHIRHAVELASRHDSLHSICLSNEPLWNTSGRDPWSRPAWTEYLIKRHGGNLATLNALYGTTYTAFEEVSAYAINPWSGKAPVEEGALRRFYDWTRFNNKNFADWHHWMHDIVKSVAPHIPTHSKIMAGFVFNQGRQHHGIDPELFCRVTDIAGCDTGSGSVRSAMLYDLLHSFRGQPVYNSEDHLTADSSAPVSTSVDRVYAATFQPVIHHRLMNAFWIWTEPVARHLAGHVTLRPANLHATGKAAFDLLRLHEEVSALREAPAEVALLFSPTSIFWQSAYERCVLATYEALVYSGFTVTFVSERQLLEGVPPSASTVIVPFATHTLTDVPARLDAWARKGITVIKVGAESLAFDEYNRDVTVVSDDADRIVIVPWRAPIRAEAESVQIGGVEVEQGLERLASDGSPFRDRLLALLHERDGAVTLRKGSSGDRAWEVEFRSVRHNGRLLIFLMNHAEEDQTVGLDLVGERVDLIQNLRVPAEMLKLRPKQIMLLRGE